MGLRSTRGFTIMEIILVMTLMLILSSTLLTTFGVGSDELDVAAKRLREDLEYAQDMALIQGGNFGFYAPDLISYTIFETIPANPVIDPLTHAVMNTNLTQQYHIVHFANMPPRIDFDADGIPSIVGNNVITLTDGENSKVLTVNAITGLVTGP